MCWLDWLQWEEILYWPFRCNNSTSLSSVLRENTRERTDRHTAASGREENDMHDICSSVIRECDVVSLDSSFSCQNSYPCSAGQRGAWKTKGGNSRAWTHVQMIRARGMKKASFFADQSFNFHTVLKVLSLGVIEKGNFLIENLFQLFDEQSKMDGEAKTTLHRIGRTAAWKSLLAYVKL